MVKNIEIDQFLELRKSLPLFDVRSPGEYNAGHIPGAFNLPLFDDEERKIVGTAYKQQGREVAIMRGLDIAGQKLSGYVKQARKLSPGRKALMHCWRGGMRSDSLAWLLSTAGFDVYVLKGGYKTYRRHIGSGWLKAEKIILLSGKTGSGKTFILERLKERGHQVLDLEGIAHHKGSAFGAIGQQPQPSSEQFENDLANIWHQFDLEKPIWIEDESRTIGKVFIPEKLYAAMAKASVLRIVIPDEQRIRHLIDDYAAFPKELLIESIKRITRKLGGDRATAAINALEIDDYYTAVGIILQYYDKAYTYDLTKKSGQQIYTLPLESIDEPALIERIENFCRQNQII